MVAYHIDRSNALVEGQLLTLTPLSDCLSEIQSSLFVNHLFPDGLSRHGIQYSTSYAYATPSPYHPQSIKRGIENVSTFVMEFFLELMRIRFSPQKLSRFQAFFAIPTIEDAACWPMLLQGKHQLFEVDIPDSSILYDSSHLHCGLASFIDEDNDYCVGFSSDINFALGQQYWSESRTTSPKLEYLAPFPVKILKKV